MASNDATPPVRSGQFAFPVLERTMHEKARLSILSSLVSRPDGLVFSDLKSFCDLTDGNLNRHLKVLEEAGLVAIWKGFHRNRPQTLVQITPLGRTRFLEYLTELERIVQNALQSAGAAQTNSQGTLNSARSSLGFASS